MTEEVVMAGIAAIVLFAISFIMYAVKSTSGVPWTPTGFAILGLLALAVHVAWGWWGTRNHG
jgi:multisubunit Na+/H+ antiporter MnhB subunit